MRFRVLAYLLGTLLVYLGTVLLIPLFWAVFAEKAVVQPFFYAAALSVIAGFLLKFRKKPPDSISIKESFTFVFLAWTTCALFGALPYLLSGTFTTFSDAFFESMSGFTTTGATVIEDIEALPGTILLWRSLTQWLGGMGIIVLFVAMLPRLGIRSINLLKAEFPGPGPERIVPRLAETAKTLWVVYLVLSLVEFLLLLGCGLTLFDALNHTFTTMPTGGFSTYNASIGALNNFKAEAVILVFMFISGGNFTLYFGIWQQRFRQLFKDTEFRFYIFIVVVATLIATVTTWPLYGSSVEAARKAAFQVVSIVTTTGYVTADYEQWSSLGKVILFFLMFMGASGGSTSGAMKQIRILVMIKYGLRELQKALHPAAVIPLRLGGKVIPEEMVQNIMGFNVLYILIFIISSLLVGTMGLEPVASLSVAAACLGNVGPALGSVGPTKTYAHLPVCAKLILPFIMLLGRLEIYTVLILLLPNVRTTRFQFMNALRK